MRRRDRQRWPHRQGNPGSLADHVRRLNPDQPSRVTAESRDHLVIVVPVGEPRHRHRSRVQAPPVGGAIPFRPRLSAARSPIAPSEVSPQPVHRCSRQGSPSKSPAETSNGRAPACAARGRVAGTRSQPQSPRPTTRPTRGTTSRATRTTGCLRARPAACTLPPCRRMNVDRARWRERDAVPDRSQTPRSQPHHHDLAAILPDVLRCNPGTARLHPSRGHHETSDRGLRTLSATRRHRSAILCWHAVRSAGQGGMECVTAVGRPS